MPTPQTHGSTHYFIVHRRDFALHDEGVTTFMREQLMIAFREDVEALTRLNECLPNRIPIAMRFPSPPTHRVWRCGGICSKGPAGAPARRSTSEGA